MTFSLTDFTEDVQNKLQKGGLDSPENILLCSCIRLKNLKLSLKDIENVRLKAAVNVCPKMVSVNDLLNSKAWKRISFGCKSLDSLTKGGIPTRGITEIFGESGAGKTQLLLQLSLSVQLSPLDGGLNKGAVFICTEDMFPSKRLYQLIDKFHRHHGNKIEYAQNIFIEHIIETDDLLKCVANRLPHLLNTNQIGLIVIDSIAGIFRLEANIITRANAMRNLSKHLHNLAEEHNCAIVCSNQVTSIQNAESFGGLAPSLGLAWANLVRVRFRVSKTHKQSFHNEAMNNYTSYVRNMDVVFSPDLKCDNAEFLITSENGITDIE